MKEQTLNILQNDNYALHGILWSTDEKPKAILQITHGMTEHICRYKKFAKELCSQGIAVAGFDLRGHGNNLYTEISSVTGKHKIIFLAIMRNIPII